MPPLSASFMDHLPLYLWLGGLAFSLTGLGFWLEKTQKTGSPFLIPPFLLQFLGIALFLALGADLIADLSGQSWTPHRLP